jgi:4-amino-4-deoxy-L-arabinose transferase-like glycosyltransferase
LNGRGELELLGKPLSKIDREQRAQIAFLIGLCLLLYFLNLGRWDLWAPDEPRYAQIAKEIVSGGDWILMHINGSVYGDKPPLFFWFIALSSYLWKGFTSFSVRFPSAFFGTLTVLLVFFLGGRLYSSRTGFFSSILLATSLLFAQFSTRANIDATLTFFTTASLLCFYRWYRHEKAEEVPQHRRLRILFVYGFYVSMALATLAKGPIGFILPLLVSLIYLLVQKDYREIKRMKLAPGIPLLLAIVLAWYLPAVWMGGMTYLEQHLFKHTTQAFRTGWTHPQPFYYYLYNFPIAFLPWVFFLPSAMVYGCSRLTVEKRREFLFLLTWFIVIFIFFSFSKSKRTLYLLPLFPAVSIMVGKWWSDLIRRPLHGFRREWTSLPIYVFAAMSLAAGVAIPFVISRKFPVYLFYSLPVAFLLTGCSLVLFILCRSKNYKAILFLLVGVMAAGYLYAFGLIFPLENSRMSARFISEEITSRFQPGDQLAVFRGIEADPYNYYTGVAPISVLLTRYSLHQFVRSRARVFCLLTFQDFSQFFGRQGDPEVQLISRRRVRNDDVVLISNR